MKRRMAMTALMLTTNRALAQDRLAQAEKAITKLLFAEEADELTADRFINSLC